MIVGIRNRIREEALPFIITEFIMVQFFKLGAEIRYKVSFAMNGQIHIPLFTEHTDKLLFQRSFTLILI